VEDTTPNRIHIGVLLVEDVKIPLKPNQTGAMVKISQPPPPVRA